MSRVQIQSAQQGDAPCPCHCQTLPDANIRMRRRISNIVAIEFSGNHVSHVPVRPEVSKGERATKQPNLPVSSILEF
ncbi:MAG: hypothetical protein JNM76_06485 [Betaproteobacteria bacterium]|nr:hypothetical protein [Betaproteobacteria bacterium]